MSKNIRGNNAHLTLSDRIFIEQELNQRSTFYSIAKVLHKDPTTISKEVKRSRTLSQAFPFWDKCRLCWNYKQCRERDVCGDRFYRCKKACRYCYHVDPTKYCLYFIPYNCHRPDKAPFVCNSGDHYRDCPLDKAYYSAESAQEKYDKTL